ncbi:unnamed protein product, partial [Leptidea sinapis]
SHIH